MCSGGTPKSTEPSYYGGNIPWLNTKEINFCRINKTEKTITDSGFQNSATKWIEKDSIIVAMYGATAAKVAINRIPLTTNQACCNLTIDPNLADFRFVYFYLCHKYISLAALANGGAQQNLNAQQIKDFDITLPSLKKQKRIADILWSLDDKIELNRRINANLEAQAQVLFRLWFINSEAQNSNPGFFNDIIQTTSSGDWGQETPKGNYISEVYCIRGADIPDIKCGDKGKLPTRYILEKNLVNKKLSENDLVVEISGGSPTQSTGRICLITKALLNRLDKDVICTNFCRALKPIQDYSFFTYLYWQYLYSKDTMFSYENGTTGIKNLNITDFINKEPIIIPEKKKILEFNKVLQPIFDMIYKNGRENERLSTLRDTLLPKLMTGEIKI